MSLPASVSLHVPYAENEKQFLLLAVQTAVRAFRMIQANSGDRAVCDSISRASAPFSSSTIPPQETQES